ncbi:MAG: HEPN domain-containing protein [Planctomycetes bacterium]|nr:HEPN domain-containing protein [Planctomycetota bacterium]
MNPEQIALLKKAKDSLRGARVLADEGLFDFAVSRAYYTMLYAVESFLLQAGETYSKHSAVIAAFGQKFAKTGTIPANFHRYLIEAQEARNVGDYDAGPGLTQAQALEQIKRAEEFVKLAEQYLGQFP